MFGAKYEMRTTSMNERQSSTEPRVICSTAEQETRSLLGLISIRRNQSRKVETTVSKRLSRKTRELEHRYRTVTV